MQHVVQSREAASFQRRERVWQFVPMLVALVLFGAFAVWRVRQAQSKAEREALAPIIAALGLPETADASAVNREVTQFTAYRQEAKRGRMARMVGLEAGWDQIFQALGAMKPEAQQKVLRAISQEYGLPYDTVQHEFYDKMLKGFPSAILPPRERAFQVVKRATAENVTVE